LSPNTFTKFEGKQGPEIEVELGKVPNFRPISRYIVTRLGRSYCGTLLGKCAFSSNRVIFSNIH